MEYTVDYFIAKFESIPKKNYIRTYEPDCKTPNCPYGHLTRYEQLKFCKIWEGLGYSIAEVVCNNSEFQSKNVKGRILLALYSIRDKELSEANLKEASKIVSENKIELV